MEVMLTPRFFDTPTAWSPTKAEPNRYCSLAFNAGTTYEYSGSPWNNNGSSQYYTSPNTSNEFTKNNTTNPEATTEPPTLVYASSDNWDDVSLLNDDPDEDDDQLLPPSTYDVLAPLLDEMYKDESEVEVAEACHDLVDSAVEWNEQ